MAGPDLTPELLAQLENDVAEWPGTYRYRFEVYSCPHSCCGGETAHVTDTQGDGCVIAAESVARMLNAVPALVAAAKERDQRNAEIDRYQALLLEVMRERDEAMEEVARLRSAAPALPVSPEAEAMVEGLMQEARRAEIERKP